MRFPCFPRIGRIQTGVFPAVLIAFLLLASFCGCGGGGSSPGGGSGGGGGGIGDTSSPARQAVYDAINTKFASLPHRDVAEDNQAIYEFVKTQPEFEATGYDPDAGSVWARFRGGPTLIICNNQPYELYRQAKAPRMPPLLTRGGSLPSGKKVMLINAFKEDDLLQQGFADQTHELIRQALNHKGYSIASYTGDVDTFKTVQNVDVLLVSGHGTRAEIGGKQVYCLPTSQHVSTELDTRYAQYLGEGSVGPVLTPTVEGLAIRLIKRPAYYLTPTFVTKYWSFTPRSFVMINTCLSSSKDPQFADSTAFRDACIAKSASVYAGWTQQIHNGDSAETARYLFNSLAGTNFLDDLAKTPPQRAFTWGDLLTDLATQKRGNLTGHTYTLDRSFSEHNKKGIDNGYALLAFKDSAARDTEDTFGILAPSIYSMDIAANELRIYGVFGAVPGKVTLDGTDLPVDSWSSTLIKCTLPPRIQAAGSVGDVVVAVDGIKSNVAQLTGWDITFRQTDTYVFSGSDPTNTNTVLSGSYTVTADFLVKLRVDVRAARLLPGEQPPSDLLAQQFTLVSHGLPTSDLRVVRYAASGQTQSETFFGGASQTETHTYYPYGKAPVLFDDTDPRANAATIFGSVDQKARALNIYMGVQARNLFLAKNQRGEESSGILQTDIIGIDTRAYSDQFTLQLDNAYSIQPGNMTRVYDHGYYRRTARLTWSAAPALHPPDPEAERHPKDNGKR
ncbi:MAG: hypothetical protein IT210_22455 [Armatimonadetes bacterium]|nr:hypothetical protein [Armatimonadota bacterium]